MLSLEKIRNIDSEKIYQVYDNWAELALDSYEKPYQQIEFPDIDQIIFAGMGGSGTIGDIFASILSKTNLHVSIVKGYHLPNTVDENTLVVTSSVSGNTNEALTVLELTRKSKCKTIAFSSGGKMEKYCVENNLEYRKIPSIHSPRASFPIYVYSILKVLESVMPISKNNITESILELSKQKEKIATSNLTSSNNSLQLAQWITGIPLVYHPFGLQAASIRFKNAIQENAKSHAIVEDVVEACHNGIVAWEKKSVVQPILLTGQEDYIKTKELWKIIKKYFIQNNIDFKEIQSVKGSILAKLMSLIYQLDFTSVYLSYLRNIDPSPVKSIEFIKKQQWKKSKLFKSW